MAGSSDDADTDTGSLAMSAAWSRLCDRLKVVGERIARGEFSSDSRDRAEGLRHLGRLTAHALQSLLDFQDTEFPAFHRYDDDSIKWGGPNADNHYLRAKIAPNASYRLRLDASGLRALIVSTPEGDMQQGRYRVFEERNLEQLTRDGSGRLEVILSPEPHEGNWIPLHPDTDHVLVRLYVADWEKDAAPHVYIERIGNEGQAPQRLEAARVAAQVDAAAEWVENTVDFWSRFLADARRRGKDNVLSPPRTVPGGAADILYGAGWWNLQPDEALLIDCEVPQARYWSFQLYSAPWFESLDIANRISSLNGEQTRVDDDGRFRIVVAAEDPGTPNWLDSEGRPNGLVSYRWIWSSTAPVPTARVIPLASIRRHVPDDTPFVDVETRRLQIMQRREAIARRFRR